MPQNFPALCDCRHPSSYLLTYLGAGIAWANGFECVGIFQPFLRKKYLGTFAEGPLPKCGAGNVPRERRDGSGEG